MLDMNNLKIIKKGHLEGNRILIALADVLKKIFAPDWNMLYRIGGDEFYVILKEPHCE